MPDEGLIQACRTAAGGGQAHQSAFEACKNESTRQIPRLKRLHLLRARMAGLQRRSHHRSRSACRSSASWHHGWLEPVYGTHRQCETKLSSRDGQ